MQIFTLEQAVLQASVEVRIYASLRAMRNAIFRNHGCSNQQGYGFIAIERGMECPRIYLCRHYLSLDIVAHEFFHFAVEYGAAKFGPRKIYQNQEQWITLAGEMVRLFWNRYMGLDDDYYIVGTKKLFQQDFEVRKP